MSIFSTNQARHFYVASEISPNQFRINDESNVGAIKCMVENNAAGCPINFWFEYMSPAGPVRSDIIPVNHVREYVFTDGTTLRRPFTAKKITLDPSMLDNGNVIGGQDCIMNIAIRNYNNAGTEYRIHSYGAVHTMSTMDASAFYKKMAESLAVNLSRTSTLKVYVTESGTPTEVKKGVNLSSVTADGIVLVEAEQPWKLGKTVNTYIDFNLNGNTVIVDGEELLWAVIADATDASTYGEQKNGRDTADLEWFCMGERGDIYRGMGWPNNWDTTYLANPTKEYDYLDIRYFFQGEGVSVQQSEKSITIVMEHNSESENLAIESITPEGLLNILNDKGLVLFGSEDEGGGGQGNREAGYSK